MSENFISYSDGYSKDGVTLADVQTALLDLREMEEGGAFWVCLITDREYFLETAKDWKVTGVFEGEEGEFNRHCQSEAEVEGLYALLLRGAIAELQAQMRKTA